MSSRCAPEVNKRKPGVALVIGLVGVLSLSGFFPSPIAAQEEGASGGAGFFAVGVQQMDAGALDRRLVGAGLPGVGSTALTLGGGGYAVRDRWRIGGDGHGLRGSRRVTADGAFETRVAGGYGLFTVGYDLAPGSRLGVTPQVGIGGGGVHAYVDGLEAPTFDEILEDSRRGVRLSRRSFLASLGLGVRVPLSRPGTGSDGRSHVAGIIGGVGASSSGSSGGDKGLVLGLRAGYLLSFAESGWSSGASRVAGGPRFTAKGFHLRLTIGW